MTASSQERTHRLVNEMANADLFAAAEAFTLRQEGGWVDNAADRGGPTMNGITLAVYRAWLNNPNTTPEQLKAISSEAVQAIYKNLYWTPISGDLLRPGVGLAVFDAAVNMGPHEAAKLLQTCVGTARDGVIGPVTVAWANRMESTLVISRYSKQREAYYRGCVGFKEFGRGWLARSEACSDAALKIADLSRRRAPRRPPVGGVGHRSYPTDEQ